MITAFVVSVVILSFLIPIKKNRELIVGKHIYYNEIKTKKSHIITEKVRFKNSIECIVNYNILIFQYSHKPNEYNDNNWTFNRIPILNGFIEIFRYGNQIKMIKTIDK